MELLFKQTFSMSSTASQNKENDLFEKARINATAPCRMSIVDTAACFVSADTSRLC